jgi:hypothetical protein
MPLWYGDKTRDVCSALYVVDRLTNASRIGAWANDQRRCDEFYAILRGKALVWWESLKDHNVHLDNWNEVKTAFLKAYEPKYSPKLTFTNFAELQQRNNEGVHDFYLRISEVCRKMFFGRPAALFAVRRDYPRAPAANAYDDNIINEIKKEGLEDDEMYIKHQIFIAGVKEEYRIKLIEENKATLGESVYYAIELEATLNEKKQGMRLAAIEKGDVVELDEEDKEAINALRFKRNGGGGNKFSSKRQPPKANGSTICRYCKKNGHFQKDCRSRIRDKAPMVDASGKPYTRKINPVASENPEADEAVGWANEEEPIVIGSVRQTAALNWE